MPDHYAPIPQPLQSVRRPSLINRWKHRIQRMMGQAPPPPVGASGPSPGVQQSGGMFTPEAARERQKRMVPRAAQGLFNAIRTPEEKRKRPNMFGR